VAAFDTEFQEWIGAIASAGPSTGPSAGDGYAATVVTDAGVTALYSGDRVPIDLGVKPELYSR
jgi:myo-inositol 2-dehydrogenase/D-chiro-inositol 1-dehydrogenase